MARCYRHRRNYACSQNRQILNACSTSTTAAPPKWKIRPCLSLFKLLADSLKYMHYHLNLIAKLLDSILVNLFDFWGQKPLKLAQIQRNCPWIQSDKTFVPCSTFQLRIQLRRNHRSEASTLPCIKWTYNQRNLMIIFYNCGQNYMSLITRNDDNELKLR